MQPYVNTDVGVVSNVSSKKSKSDAVINIKAN